MMIPGLLRQLIAGDRRALARSITLVEAGQSEMMAGLAACQPRRHNRPGVPDVIGITGPPGAGKSTFVDRLVTEARARDERVAVVAVDPSSPFSGGAILGDRVRMDRHAEDSGVYIRSLSARGAAGGLSRATGQVVDLLDLAGYDRILVETVGVGQGELAVLEVADSVVVVLTPESGDTVQTMKAGLLEVADVFVVNKCDRPGAEALARDLELSVHLDLGADTDGHWVTPVFMTCASEGRGVSAVLAGLERHRAYLQGPGLASWGQRRARGRHSVCVGLVMEWAAQWAMRGLAGPLGQQLTDGTLRPEQAAAALIGQWSLAQGTEKRGNHD